MSNTQLKSEKAYQEIKQAIIAGQLESGKIYSITELSETFRIGRTPAREALVVLASEGLIDPIPRSGYQVKPISIQDLLEIFHLRKVLEVESAGLAAEKITADGILLLEENNRQEQEIASVLESNISPASYQKGFNLNLEFHLTLARSSGNQRLAELVEDLLTELERFLVHDPYLAEPQQHFEIIKKLKQRDKPGAEEAMLSHLEDTKDRTLSRL